MNKQLKVVIELTSAVAIEGVICRAGEQVEVSQDLAKDLLNRGRGNLVELDEDQIESDDIDLTRLNKPQLVEQATAWGIENADALTKAQIIEAIQAKAEEDN